MGVAELQAFQEIGTLEVCHLLPLQLRRFLELRDDLGQKRYVRFCMVTYTMVPRKLCQHDLTACAPRKGFQDKATPPNSKSEAAPAKSQLVSDFSYEIKVRNKQGGLR